MSQFYTIDATGSTRYVFGPYATYEAAKKAAGNTCRVVLGAGLRNGQKMTEAEFQVRVRTGSIYKASEDAGQLVN